MFEKSSFFIILSIIMLGISIFGIGVSAQISNEISRSEFEQYKEKRAEIISNVVKEFDNRTDQIEINLTEVQTNLNLLREDVNRIKNVLENFYFFVIGVFLSSLGAGSLGTYGIMKGRENKKKG